MKKNPIICLLFLLFFGSLTAQSVQHNFEESLALAKDAQKGVLMIFSGSDWCKPCMQLKQSILTQQKFTEFSDSNLVILELDFPYRRKNRLSKKQRKYNEQLAEQYNKEGSFPKVLLFDDQANLIGNVAFQPNQSPKEFIDQIETLRESKVKNITY